MPELDTVTRYKLDYKIKMKAFKKKKTLHYKLLSVIGYKMALQILSTT